MRCPLIIMKDQLRGILKGRVTIVGVGNPMCGDDSFGHALAEAIKGKVGAEVIAAGSSPENHLGKIRKSRPDTILIVDAADIGAQAGEAKLLRKQDIPLYGLSTHNASLALLFDFLEAQTEAAVYMLAVQPYSTGFDKPISSLMNDKVDLLRSALSEIVPK